MKGCCVLSKAFSAPNDRVVFIFQLVYMVDYNDRFLYVEPLLNLWNEAYLIMVDDFLCVLEFNLPVFY